MCVWMNMFWFYDRFLCRHVASFVKKLYFVCVGIFYILIGTKCSQVLEYLTVLILWGHLVGHQPWGKLFKNIYIYYLNYYFFQTVTFMWKSPNVSFWLVRLRLGFRCRIALFSWFNKYVRGTLLCLLLMLWAAMFIWWKAGGEHPDFFRIGIPSCGGFLSCCFFFCS